LDEAMEGGVFSMERDVAVIMKQVVDCLAYIHSHKIVHCDLKPANIAFVNKTDLKIKLLDFGLANRLKIGKGFRRAGTPSYMAPEVIQGNGFTESADMWAVGVILYELLLGEDIFQWLENRHENKCKKRIEELFTGSLKGMISKNAEDCIKELVKYAPLSRPTARELLLHPFFTADNEKNLEADVISKMKRFARRGKLQKALLPLMTDHYLSMHSYLADQLTTVASEMGIDKNATLNLEHFRKCIQNIDPNLSAHHVEKLFKNLEKDYNGVNFSVLEEWFEYDFLMSQDERLWDFIAQIDEEGNGKISIQNVERAIQKIAANNADYQLAEYLLVIRDIFHKDEYGYEHFAEIFRRNEGSEWSGSFFDSCAHSTLDWSEYSKSYSSIQSLPISSELHKLTTSGDYVITVDDHGPDSVLSYKGSKASNSSSPSGTL